MKLKYLQTIVDATGEIESRVPAVAYSPNGRKLAIATASLRIVLMDEKFQQRDNFSTKPVDSKYGKKSYMLKALAFSPDSTKLAVGQTDNIVFVYRLGEGWDEKKVICNKFPQSSAVMAVLWPGEAHLIIGLVDGKVRSGSSASNKCSTLYKTNSMVIALAQHTNGKSFISGHVDGSIILYSFESRTQNRVCIHSTPPYCLAYSSFAILVAGADRRIVSYTEQGRPLQNFDYSRGEEEDEEKEFTVAVLDITGRSAVFGSFDRFRQLTWNAKRGAWDEGSPLVLRNFYTVSAMAWKPDGTTLVAGNLIGGVIVMDCSLKRALLKNTFETMYVSPSQVLIKDINTPERQCMVRSKKNHPITDIKVMGRSDAYVIAHTPHSMLLADINNDLCSEIAWDWGGNEKFYVENDHVCMIINAGEITFVEYGKDEVAGWIRTERVNPHQISVCLNERARRGAATSGSVKRVAYLLDSHTISIVSLGATNQQLAQISHSGSIDWLELNDVGNKLLYRDVRSALFLYQGVGYFEFRVPIKKHYLYSTTIQTWVARTPRTRTLNGGPASSIQERFESVVYAGLSKDTIKERLVSHSMASKNLFTFTSNGAEPKFIVVYSEQVLSAGAAAFTESHLIALAGSDHAILNTEQGAKWKDLSGVTREENYRSACVSMAKLLVDGSIYPCNWSAGIKRNAAKQKLTLDVTAPEESPTVGRKRKMRTPSVPPTPVSALERFHFDPSPGSVTVRTSSGSFNYDGSIEDLRAKKAELNEALEQEEERLRREAEEDAGA